jgi:RNA-directed DNA polymerase
VVNEAKSAVDRPWNRKFLGYSVTVHKSSKLKVAATSLNRLMVKIRALMRMGRGRNIGRTIQDLNPLLRGWSAYFRWTQVLGVLEDLDSWIRRKLRCILWRQWKRPYTRGMNLMKAGLTEERAFRSAFNQRGPWWNSGKAHMNHAFPKKYFDQLGLVSVLETVQRLQYSS